MKKKDHIIYQGGKRDGEGRGKGKRKGGEEVTSTSVQRQQSGQGHSAVFVIRLPTVVPVVGYSDCTIFLG